MNSRTLRVLHPVGRVLLVGACWYVMTSLSWNYLYRDTDAQECVRAHGVFTRQLQDPSGMCSDLLSPHWWVLHPTWIEGIVVAMIGFAITFAAEWAFRLLYLKVSQLVNRRIGSTKD